ncbi:PEP-CTERM sorting domain-containing protein [Methylobacillus gramineus]|uniref:PEP-CTERM sorting domain-containing protein n=1 Tax=Methylobacillus gramineus TaxID=755169 RepID=UPI001CFF769D|nr:PEP-CTERM sorting domain-containing protein [Methylobacillus gramineus]MCB5184048.1 PEP-CTERM sorting domain-containing protein [Methylobacillus gramineus]
MKLAQLLVITGLFSTTTLLQAAPQYSLTTLGPLNGYSESFAASINNHGQVTGHSDLGDYSVRNLATLWSNGTTSAITGGLGKYSTAISLNDHGQVVGTSYTQSRFYQTAPTPSYYDGHATLWQNGKATTLPALSGQYAHANDINNNGQVIGWSLDTQNQTIATVWNNNTPTALTSQDGYRSEANAINDNDNIVGTLYQGFASNAVFWNSSNQLLILGSIGGNGGSEAFAINNHDIIVGWSSSLDGRQHATLWDNGQAIDLGRLNGYASYAYGVNNLGNVVGSFIGDHEGIWDEYAILWKNGSAINLNSLIDRASGITLVSAYDINDQGWIIAQGKDANDNYSAYLLAPVPEPETYALLLVGLGLINILSRNARATNA